MQASVSLLIACMPGSSRQTPSAAVSSGPAIGSAALAICAPSLLGLPSNDGESAMRPNRLENIWASGKSANNAWLAIPSIFSAEMMAQQGWDSLTIDMQHGQADYAALIQML